MYQNFDNCLEKKQNCRQHFINKKICFWKSEKLKK